MDPDLLQTVCERFGLGTPTANPVEVSGGLLNTMWRVDSSNGTYAVKVLNESAGSPVAHFNYDNAYLLERAAAANGILLPEPVLDASGSSVMAGPQRVVVHNWLEGRVPHGGLTANQTTDLGRILARIHQLDISVPEVRESRSIDPNRWRQFASKSDNQQLKDQLTEAVNELEAIDRFIDTYGEITRRRLLCHNDINHKNLMIVGDAIWVIDWETTSMQEVTHEIGGTALDASAGDDERLVMFLSGYQLVLALPPVDETWLVTHLLNQTEFFAFNVSVLSDPNVSPDLKAKSESIAVKMISNLRTAAANIDENLKRLRSAVDAVVKHGNSVASRNGE